MAVSERVNYYKIYVSVTNVSMYVCTGLWYKMYFFLVGVIKNFFKNFLGKGDPIKDS